MNIMMIGLNFPPEVNSASHIFYGLGSEFVRRGHHVTVVTGFPTYNVDRSTLPAQYKSGLWLREMFEGMELVRSRTLKIPRNLHVLRGVDQITTSLGFTLAGAFLPRTRPDVILVYSPPMFLGISGWLLRMITGAELVLNVQDLFPQNAVDLGILKNKFLIALFERVESFIYRRSNAIAVHSEGNRHHVVQRGGSAARTFVVLNPVDTRSIVPGERNNAFRSCYRIGEEELIVSYAGTIGYAQDLDSVIEAAALMKDQSNVIFYIVGDGVEKSRLMKQAEGMTNVRFLPMLDRAEYVELLNASDVCLSTLLASMMTPVVPAKIMSIMASGRPVVASMPLNGDAPKIIREAKSGICVEPQNPVKLVEAIKTLLENPSLASQYARNGRAWVEANCSLEGCAVAYERIFDEITKEK